MWKPKLKKNFFPRIVKTPEGKILFSYRENNTEFSPASGESLAIRFFFVSRARLGIGIPG
jgi:hypothetical protein